MAPVSVPSSAEACPCSPENTCVFTQAQKEAFAADILQAGKEVCAQVSPADVQRCLDRILLTSNACFLAAVLLFAQRGWLGVCAAVFFGVHITSRWAIVAHHTLHRGFDTAHSSRYRSTSFGRGWRRLLDWPDWIFPQAWAMEHNKNHHCHLNEYCDYDNADPDLVEMNMQRIIASDFGVPVVNTLFKDAIFWGSMFTWRWMYYATNTLDRLWMSERPAEERRKFETSRTITFFTGYKHVPLPYFLAILARAYIPAMLYWLGFCALYNLVVPGSFSTVLRNLLLGELVANVHSFCIIVPNHCGGDLYKFDKPAAGQTDIIFRSVLGSVNFDLGSFFVDFMHGYLNYQVEHHMFPDLSPLHYELLAPKVQEICKKHGLKYVQENVFKRVFCLRQTIQGNEKMMLYQGE